MTRRGRDRLAAGLERAVLQALSAHRGGLSAAVPVNGPAVCAARTELLELACRLRGPDEVSPEGIEQVRELLTDGSGPLFAPADPDALREAADAAMLALGDVRAWSI